MNPYGISLSAKYGEKIPNKIEKIIGIPNIFVID